MGRGRRDVLLFFWELGQRLGCITQGGAEPYKGRAGSGRRRERSEVEQGQAGELAGEVVVVLDFLYNLVRYLEGSGLAQWRGIPGC
jgi:hypothetical protein